MWHVQMREQQMQRERGWRSSLLRSLLKDLFRTGGRDGDWWIYIRCLGTKYLRLDIRFLFKVETHITEFSANVAGASLFDCTRFLGPGVHGQ